MVHRQRRLTVTFDGSAAEYFRVWVINVGLCLVTLGLYGPWARVRKKQYLYGQTRLDGTPFRYVAPPLAILKGQLMSLAVLALTYVTTGLYPSTRGIGSLLLLIALPWIWVHAIAFEARSTTFRNLRFEFRGTYATALRCLAGALLLALTIVGLPWAYCRVRGYVINHLRYGGTGASIVWSGTCLLPPFLLALGVGVVTVWFVLTQVSEAVLSQGNAGDWVIPSCLAVSLTTFLLITSMLEARAVNAFGRRTKLGSISFKPSYRARDLLAIYLTNTLAVVASIGLLVPWATVRLARYRAQHLVVVTRGDWAQFAAAGTGEARVRGAFAESLAASLEVTS